TNIFITINIRTNLVHTNQIQPKVFVMTEENRCETCQRMITTHRINVGNFVIADTTFCSFECEKGKEAITQAFTRGLDCLNKNFNEHITAKCDCVNHTKNPNIQKEDTNVTTK